MQRRTLADSPSPSPSPRRSRSPRAVATTTTTPTDRATTGGDDDRGGRTDDRRRPPDDGDRRTPTDEHRRRPRRPTAPEETTEPTTGGSRRRGRVRPDRRRVHGRRRLRARPGRLPGGLGSDAGHHRHRDQVLLEPAQVRSARRVRPHRRRHPELLRLHQRAKGGIDGRTHHARRQGRRLPAGQDQDQRRRGARLRRVRRRC